MLAGQRARVGASRTFMVAVAALLIASLSRLAVANTALSRMSRAWVLLDNELRCPRRPCGYLGAGLGRSLKTLLALDSRTLGSPLG